MPMTSTPRYWIGVASREHVQWGVAGGFCQLCHGKAQPLRRMNPGDWLVYYSPKLIMGKPEPCQAFTALGQVTDETVYPFAMTEDFVPFRRDIQFLPVQEAPIQPLIPTLDFIQDKQHWGYAFRFGYLQVNAPDFIRIARALGHPELP